MWDLHLVSHLLIHCQLLQIYLTSINTHTHTHYTLCAHTHHDHSLDVSAVLLSRCSDPEIHVEVLDTAVKLRTDLRVPGVMSNSVRTPLFELVCQPISRRAFDTTLVLLTVAKSPFSRQIYPTVTSFQTILFYNTLILKSQIGIWQPRKWHLCASAPLTTSAGWSAVQLLTLQVTQCTVTWTHPLQRCSVLSALLIPCSSPLILFLIINMIYRNNCIMVTRFYKVIKISG